MHLYLNRPIQRLSLLLLLAVFFIPVTAQAISVSKALENAGYHSKRGEHFFKNKQYAKAEKEYDGNIKYLRKVWSKCNGLALTCRGRMNRDVMRKNLAKAYNSRAVCRFVLKNYSAAKSDAESALHYKSYYADAHFILGFIAIIQRNKAKALKHYDIIIAEKPKLATTLLNSIKAMK